MDFADFSIPLQILGAVLSLIQYLLVQSRRLEATEPRALMLLIVASAILLGSAIIGLDWGFVFLEATWVAMISTTLLMRWREPRVAAAAEPDAVVEPVAALPVSATASVPVAAFEAPGAERDYTEPAFIKPVGVERHNTGELELAGSAS